MITVLLQFGAGLAYCSYLIKCIAIEYIETLTFKEVVYIICKVLSQLFRHLMEIQFGSILKKIGGWVSTSQHLICALILIAGSDISVTHGLGGKLIVAVIKRWPAKHRYTKHVAMETCIAIAHTFYSTRNVVETISFITYNT